MAILKLCIVEGRDEKVFWNIFDILLKWLPNIFHSVPRSSAHNVVWRHRGRRSDSCPINRVSSPIVPLPPRISRVTQGWNAGHLKVHFQVASDCGGGGGEEEGHLQGPQQHYKIIILNNSKLIFHPEESSLACGRKIYTQPHDYLFAILLQG